jgi:hypothetical protein
MVDAHYTQVVFQRVGSFVSLQIWFIYNSVETINKNIVFLSEKLVYVIS